jgi:hypothetical protein
MTFLIESIAACLAFTLFVFLMSRNPIKQIFNYPPAIIERCKSLGLVDDSNPYEGYCMVTLSKSLVFANFVFEKSAHLQTSVGGLSEEPA